VKTLALLVLVVAACHKPPGAPSPESLPTPTRTPTAEPAPGACPVAGWSSAVVVDGQFESGFEPTIAWNPVAKAPVLFDVAQQDDNTPTHWLRLVARDQDRWIAPRTLEGMVSGVMAAAVDDTGVVHLAFTRFDANGGPFLGTVGPGGTWTVEGPIEPGLGFIEDRMSMLLGPGGDVLIAYSDNPTRTVKVAARRGGAWQLETVATGASLMRDHTLVRDSRGGLHVVASDWGSGDLRVYSRAANGTWPFVVVGQHAHGASLAIDGKDVLHVSWVDWQANELEHSAGPPGGPFVTTRVVAGNLGNDTSIAVAATGTVSIAYDQRDCDDLHLATRLPGASWTAETVDAAGELGSDSEIVVDGAGCVHIVYGDSTAWDLKYATRCP